MLYLPLVLTTMCSLDRTNFVQDIISRVMLEQYLSLIRREWLHSGTLWSYHRELWAENGDALSRIYAGTGALNTSFTRSGKRTLAGLCFRLERICGVFLNDISRCSVRRHQECIPGVHQQLSG